MNNRREFLRSLALVPLPLTLPWLAEKAERKPRLDGPIQPPPNLWCACGTVILPDRNSHIEAHYYSGPFDYRSHWQERCVYRLAGQYQIHEGKP